MSVPDEVIPETRRAH